LPLRLSRTYNNVLRITGKKVKAVAAALSDSFTIKREIAVADIENSSLTNLGFNVVWGEQAFKIPAGRLTAKTGKSYKCSKVSAQGESGLVTAAIDLDKCTFSVSIKGCDLDLTSGEVDFGINFTDFDETAGIDLQ
jgi:hypothetical protein